MNDVMRGCECNNCGAHGPDRPAETAPVAYLISRNGKNLTVCTRCKRSTDEIVMFMVDERTRAIDLIRYDELGALLLIMDFNDRKVEVNQA